MAQDFDTLYKGYLAQLEGTSQPENKAPFDPIAYLASIGIKPKETGLIKGTVSALGRGVGGAVKQFGQALEYDQDRNPDLVNKAGSYISKGGDYLSNLITKPVAEPDSRKEAFFGAMESVVPSLAYSIPAYVGGALGSLALPGVGTAIGATGGAALSFPIMQQAAAQDAYETISKLRPDIPEEQKRQMAEKSGLWEAGPEAATQVAGSLIMSASPQGRAVKTVADVAKSLFKPGLKTLAKNIALDAPVEMAGEFATGVGQANVLKEGGVLPQVDLIKEGLKGAESAAYMTPFVGLLGTGVNRIKGHLLEKSVTKAIPTLENGEHDPSGLNLRKQALGMMDEQLVNTLDPEAYAHWQKLAEEAISNPNKGFDIFGSLEPKTASTGIVDTSNEHDLLDNQSTTIYPAKLIAENRNGFVPLGELTSGIETDSPFAKVNIQEEQAPLVDPDYQSMAWENLAQRGIDIQKAQDSMLGDIIPNAPESFVPQPEATEANVAQEPVATKPINLARLAKKIQLEKNKTALADELNATTKNTMTYEVAGKSIKDIQDKYAPNTFSQEDIDRVSRGEDFVPQALIDKVDSKGNKIADTDIFDYLKAARVLQLKAAEVHPNTQKKQINEQFNTDIFNKTYASLYAESEKKAFTEQALNAINKAKEAGVEVPTDFEQNLQDKINGVEKEVVKEVPIKEDSLISSRLKKKVKLSTEEQLKVEVTNLRKLDEEASRLATMLKSKKIKKSDYQKAMTSLAEEKASVMEALRELVEQKRSEGTKNDKENKGQQVSSQERREEEPKPAESKQGPSGDVPGNERQKEATSTTYTKDQIKAFEAFRDAADADDKRLANGALRRNNISKEEAKAWAEENPKEVAKTTIDDISDKIEKVFEYQRTKDGEVRSTAHSEYEAFLKQGAQVGSSKAIPKRFKQFTEQIKDHFKLKQNIFILTTSDLTNSNIVNADKSFKRLLKEDAKKYVGLYYRDSKNNVLIVLNDTKLANEYHTIETLSHELGHYIEEESYTSTDDKTKLELHKAFYNFLDRVNSKDKSALNEIYSARTPNKTWADFDRQFAAYKTEDGWDEDGLFSEWIAQQTMKYIQERQTRPEGAIAKYFATLADKLNQLFAFLQKYSIKHHLAAPAISKWLDAYTSDVRIPANLIKDSRSRVYPKQSFIEEVVTKISDSTTHTKTTVNLFGSSQAQRDKKALAEAGYEVTKSAKTLKEAFQNFGKDQNKMVELFIKNSSGEFRDRFPQVEKFLKNTLRMPFWIAEKMLANDPQAGKYVARIVKASENKTENYNKTFERFMSAQGSTKAFADIRKTVEDLTLDEKIAFDRINILGDMQEKEWTSIKEVPKSEYLKDLNDKVFNVYRDLRDFADKVYLQLQDEILESAVVKYEKKIANQLKELIKASANAEEYTPAFIEGKIKSILAMSNAEDTDLVKDILDDILEVQKTINKIKNSIGQKSGYMPRIRKQGQYKLTMYEKTENGEDKRVYMNIFPNNAFRQREKELLETNPKDIMGAAYNPDAKYTFKEEYLTKTEMSNLNVSVMASDLHLQQALEKAAEKKDLSKREIQKIKKLVSQRSAEVLLGDSAGRHKIGRVEDYIVGFNQDPMAAFEEMINNMSLSIAKTRYVQEQMDNFNTLKKISPEASEFALDYIKTTLTAKTTTDAISAKARYLTTVWFMAANLGAAMINLTQNITMGVPELSRYTTNRNAITKLGKYMMLVLPEGAKHQISRKDQRIAPVSKELPKQLQEALERYRLSGLNFDTQTFLAAGANEDLSGDALWNSFRKISDTLLKPFKAVEAANREAALLAAFDVFADLDNISLTENMTDEQFSELYDKSVKFVDTVHFMGAGNLPINLQKSAFTRTLLAMQSYGINYLNFLYNRLSSGEKDQFISAAKSIGMLGIMGGAAGAIPGGDEMNKLLKMMLGRDFKLEAEKKLKSVTSEEFSNFLVYGAPTLFGINISNNVNVRLPVVSSLIGGQDLGVSMAGAPGALATKFYKMMQFASDGEYGKALGAGSPEAFARVIRAYNEYDKGFMSQKGAPAYFEGRKLKATEGEAILKAVTGFKTVGAAKTAEVRFAEYELKEYWQDKKTKAVNKYIAGDKEALTSFNEAIKDNDQARSIINPIKMSDILRAKNKKPDKKTTKFEEEYT